MPRSRLVVAEHTSRRAGRSGVIWGAIFSLYVVASASGYASAYPTTAAREKLARSLGANSGLAALIGPARHLDTVAGFTAWRCTGVLTVVGAIWAMFLATRLLRGEEESGRWELFLSGRTTRGGATGQALAGMAIGVASLWAVTASCVVADGWTRNVRFTTTASLFLATTLVAGPAMFVAIGALTSQLFATRTQANGAAAGILGAAYLTRMVADSGTGVEWLRWVSPLGWVENVRPMDGSHVVGFVPIVALIAAASGLTVFVAARRDVGASAFGGRDARSPNVRLLGSPTGLTVRLSKWVAAGWVCALAACGLVFGLVAQSAASAVSGSATVERAIARLGGHRGGAAAYLGLTFLFADALVAFAAAGQVAATRAEEADGRVDQLLVRAVGRRHWLGGRVLVAAVIVVAASVVTGVGAWVGAASQHSGVSFTRLLEGGMNMAPGGLFVLGIGALLFGALPRFVSPVTYGIVGWSFLLELIASTVKVNRWVLDTSLLHHVAPVPAADPNWISAAGLIGVGLLAALVGLESFRRRDLAGA